MATHKIILLLTITHSDNSIGLSAEGIAGRVLLILAEVTALLTVAFFVATSVLAMCKHGNHLSVHLTYMTFFLLCGRTYKHLL